MADSSNLVHRARALGVDPKELHDRLSKAVGFYLKVVPDNALEEVVKASQNLLGVTKTRGLIALSLGRQIAKEVDVPKATMRIPTLFYTQSEVSAGQQLMREHKRLGTSPLQLNSATHQIIMQHLTTSKEAGATALLTLLSKLVGPNATLNMLRELSEHPDE